MSMTQQRIELAVALVLLVIGVAVAIAALRMPMGSLALPGPGYLPIALGVMLSVAASVLVMRSLRAGEAGNEAVTVGDRSTVLVVVSLCAAGLTLEPLGYTATAAMLLFVLIEALSTVGWRRAAGVAVTAAVVSGLFFKMVLGVRLPDPYIGLF